MSTIKRDDALASLARVREAFRFIPGAAENASAGGRTAIEWVNEWQARITGRDLDPDRLPELMGWLAGRLSSSTKLKDELLGEQRILESLRTGAHAAYGSAVWYGERATNPLAQLREDVNRAIDEAGEEIAPVHDLDEERRKRR
jgi:hypothetical protein